MHSPLRSFLSCVLLASLALLAGGCSPKAKKAKHLGLADGYYTAGDYDRAEVEYLNTIKIDGKSARAIGRLGLIYTAQGRTGRAIAYLNRARELTPNDLEVRLRMGQLYLASGKPTEARAEANFILDRQPLDAEAPLLLIATLASPEEAEPLRQRLLGLPPPAPTGAPVLTALASLDLRLGRVEQAEALVQQAKAADPKFAPAYSIEAAIQASRRNLAGTEAAFKEAAALSPTRSPRQLQYIQFKLRAGGMEEAAKMLEEITTKTPDYVPAWISLAEINLLRNQPDDAEKQLNRALSRDPDSLEARLLQGRLLALKGDPAKVVAHYERLADNFPRIAIIQQELGRAYAAAGDLTKAINSLNQALLIAPTSTDVALLLAQLNGRKGDHNAAIALLRRTIEQRPELPQPRVMLADAYRNQGNLDEALKIYQQLETQITQNAQLPLMRGLILAQQGRLTEANAAFERAYQLSPDNPTVIEQIVNLLLRERQYPRAIARIQAEQARNPQLEGFGQLLLAKISIAQNDQTLAETQLKRAIELMPDSPTAYFLLAGLYTRTNQGEKALGQLQAVLERNPKDLTALMLLSSIHDNRGEYAAARDGYEKLLSINPRAVIALNNLAYLYSEKFNNLDKAQELAQQARQISPGNPHYADTLGWVLHRKGQYPWALSLLEEAAEKLPAEAEVQFHLGFTRYMMGDEAGARTALERALQGNPTAAWAEDARRANTLLRIEPATVSSSDKAAIEQALAARPGDPVALSRLAALQERDGALDQAIATLEKSLAASAQNVTVMMNLARLHAVARNSAKALEVAKLARKVAPNDPQIALSLGRLAYQNGDYPWSASLFLEASRQLQFNPDNHFDLALALYATGRVAEAETSLREALAQATKTPATLFDRAARGRELLALFAQATTPATTPLSADLKKAGPDDVPLLMAVAAQREARGEGKAAQQAYEQCLQIFPDFTPAKIRLAVLVSRQADFDQKYLDWALQARSAQPTNAELAKALGILTYRKGDATRAVALLKEARTSRPEDSELLGHLGLAQLAAKETAAGRESLEQALKKGLTGDLSTSVRKALEESK